MAVYWTQAIMGFVVPAEQNWGPSVAQVLEIFLAPTTAQLQAGMKHLNLKLSVWHVL